MRYSHQRESIYRAVMESEKHPTAQMVYDALKNDIPKLSLGTVYRNLNQLADAGRLMKIPLADGSCRFDGTNRDHSHVICDKCGQVMEVEPPQIADIKAYVAQQTAYRLDACNLVLHGTCSHCIQAKA